MSLNLSDLYTFRTIAISKSLRKASERLSIAQPSLSYTVKKLEEYTKTRLFTRSKSGIHLTDSGLRFQSRVDRLIEEWEGIGCELQQASSAEKESLSIGCHEGVAKFALPEILPELIKSHPDLEICLHHGLSRDMCELVNQEKIDIALAMNPCSYPELIIKPLTTDQVGLWEDAENQIKDVLLYDPLLAQSQWILRNIKGHKTIKFKRFIESSSLATIAHLTRAGAGIGLLPSRVISDIPLVAFANSSNLFKDSLCLVYRPSFRQKPIHKAVLESINQCISKISSNASF